MNLSLAHRVRLLVVAVLASLCIYGCGAGGYSVNSFAPVEDPPIALEDPQFWVRGYSDFMHPPNATSWGTGTFNAIVGFQVRIPTSAFPGVRFHNIFISYRGTMQGDSLVSSSFVVYPPEYLDTIGVFSKSTFRCVISRVDTTIVGEAQLYPSNNVIVYQPIPVKLYRVGFQPQTDSL